MSHPDDARDFNLHRVIDNCILQVRMQFGLTRQEAIDHFEAFLENEREEQSDAEKARSAIAAVCSREADA